MLEYITPEKFKKTGISVPLLYRFRDLLSSNEQTVRIEWVSPDYVLKKVTILWGLLEFQTEKGEKKIFVIRGKPGFCAAVIKKLEHDGKVVSKLKEAE